MLNLLKVELKVLMKFKPAQWMFFLYPVLGIIIAIIMKIVESPAFTALIKGVFLVNMITIAIGSLFIYNDYSQNTIRNKIIVGHTRLSVYASKFAVTFLFFLACVLMFAIPTIILDAFMIGFKDVVWEAIWKNLIIVFCNILIYVTLIVFFTMSIRSVVGAISPFCTFEFLAVVGTLLLEILSSDNQELFEFVSAIPSFKATMLSANISPTDVGMSCLIALLSSIFLLAIGYFKFKKDDLN